MKRIILILAIGLFFCGYQLTFADTTVKVFSGSNAHTTRPFYVNNKWEIKWDAQGDLFQIFLYNANGTLVGLPANQIDSGTGSSYQPKGGNYYIQVNALGQWKIKIIQIK